MTDIPIIFSAPMVRALLDSRKVMTRRLAWRPARKGEPTGEGSRIEYQGAGFVKEATGHFRPSQWRSVKVGDRLWVREAVAFINNEQFGQPSYWEYRADTDGNCFAGDWPAECRDDPERPRWRPSIHMPRVASRITLVVTGVKVERLQDLSEADAIAEGVHRIGHDMPWAVDSFKDGPNFYSIDMGCGSLNQPTAAGTFSLLWKCLHGEEAWNENPEVIALSFHVGRGNIDAIESIAA